VSNIQAEEGLKTHTTLDNLVNLYNPHTIAVITTLTLRFYECKMIFFAPCLQYYVASRALYKSISGYEINILLICQFIYKTNLESFIRHVLHAVVVEVVPELHDETDTILLRDLPHLHRRAQLYRGHIGVGREPTHVANHEESQAVHSQTT